jgi:Beta-lactamase
MMKTSAFVSTKTLLLGLVVVLVVSSVWWHHGGMALEEEEKQALLSPEAQDFYDRMDMSFRIWFDAQADDVEASAVWIGVSDPLYGDHYWVYGNASTASAGPPGTSSIPTSAPATLDDHFCIGSISKTFGGTVIMLLAEQGIVSLNDTVGNLVPEFATEFPEYQDYTLEDLLRMNTLVADFLNDPNGLLNKLAQNSSGRYTLKELVAFAITDLPAHVGDRIQYHEHCNGRIYRGNCNGNQNATLGPASHFDSIGIEQYQHAGTRCGWQDSSGSGRHAPCRHVV